MRKYEADILWFVATLIALYVGFRVGQIERRHTTEAVACEPTVVGLRKNGKEIPLTSAQRDSLSGVR